MLKKVFVTLLLLLFAFTVPVVADAPTVTTDDVYVMSETSVTFYGELVKNGGYDVIDTGFNYWAADSSSRGAVGAGGMGAKKGEFSAEVYNLKPGTTYNYQAYAVNTDPNQPDSYGIIKTFTTLGGHPGDFSITSPENGDELQANSAFTVRWSASAGAEGYLVAFRDLTTNEKYIDNVDVGSDRKYRLSDSLLTPGHQYRFAVCAYIGENVEWRECEFSVEDVRTPEVISVTSSPSTADAGSEFTFVVNTNSDTEKISIEVDGYSIGEYTNYKVSGNQNVFTVKYIIKSPGQNRVVKAYAYDGSTKLTSSFASTLINVLESEPVGIPSIISPSSNGVYYVGDSVLVKWSAPSTRPDGYNVYVYSQDKRCVYQEHDITSMQVTIPGSKLDKSGLYSIDVYAYKSGYSSDDCANVLFTVSSKPVTTPAVTPTPAVPSTPVTPEVTPTPAVPSTPVTPEVTPTPAVPSTPVTPEATPTPAVPSTPVTPEVTPTLVAKSPVIHQVVASPSRAVAGSMFTFVVTTNTAVEMVGVEIDGYLVAASQRYVNKGDKRIFTITSREITSPGVNRKVAAYAYDSDTYTRISATPASTRITVTASEENAVEMFVYGIVDFFKDMFGVESQYVPVEPNSGSSSHPASKDDAVQSINAYTPSYLVHEREGITTITYSNIPYYNQNNYAGLLGETQKGTTTADFGCAVSSIAMIQEYLSGTTWNPTTIQNILQFIEGDVRWPSYIGYYRDTSMRDSGKSVKMTNSILTQIYNQLYVGHPVILGISNTNNPSNGQHYIVITGFEGNVERLQASYFTVHDPNTSYKTLDQVLNSKPFVHSLIYPYTCVHDKNYATYGLCLKCNRYDTEQIITYSQARIGKVVGQVSTYSDSLVTSSDGYVSSNDNGKIIIVGEKDKCYLAYYPAGSKIKLRFIEKSAIQSTLMEDNYNWHSQFSK